MSSRLIEEKIEMEADKRMASALGITLDELHQLDYAIKTNESNDGLVYEYVIHFQNTSPREILNKVIGLSPGNHVYLQPSEIDIDPYDEEVLWEILSSTQYENFKLSISTAKKFLSSVTNSQENFYLLVMLHAHIVATIEAFLSSTFIHTVTNSESLIKKLIEKEPHFEKQKFSLSEIYKKQENIKNIVGVYLKGLIFHRINDATRLYKSVLDIQFGNIVWLKNAITLRHHCTHRGGHDLEGTKIPLSIDSVNELIKNAVSFCDRIHNQVIITTKL